MARTTTHNPEEIFKLFFEMDGNLHAVVKDTRCPIKHYSQLYRFAEVNGFKERLADIHSKAREQTNEELASHLVIKRKEIIAICRAVFSRYAQQLADKENKMEVSMTDLNSAYKIFKTEIGEASEINRHEFSSSVTGENIIKHMIERELKEKNDKEE